ncbi:MAG: hypothetical protein ACLUE1_01505 [Adlercreutzia equolifaciens]
MATNGVKLLYPLAEPETVPLGKVELPALPAPVQRLGRIRRADGMRFSLRADANIVIGRLEEKLAAVVSAAI